MSKLFNSPLTHMHKLTLTYMHTPTHSHTHMHTLTFTAVRIGFVSDVYNVNEDDDIVTLELAVLEGQIADGVQFTVNFFTSDGSAVGKLNTS